MHHGGVGEVELGTVREHQRHRVVLLHPERGQTPGELADAVRVLPPGAGELVPAGAECDPLGVRAGGRLERPAGGARIQSDGAFGAPLGGLDLHPGSIFRRHARREPEATGDPSLLGFLRCQRR